MAEDTEAIKPLKRQVVIVVPTTLLARQHYKNFKERFEQFGVNVAQLSRLTPQKDIEQILSIFDNPFAFTFTLLLASLPQQVRAIYDALPTSQVA